MKQHRFDVEELSKRLGLTALKSAGDELRFYCPLEGCRKADKMYPTLYINKEKGTFFCHHCHASGSVTNLWATLCGVSTTVAYKQMLSSVPPAPLTAKPSQEKKFQQSEFANLKRRRDAVYTTFLNMLTLNDEHKKDLERRGLKDFSPFRSLPEDHRARWNICSILDKKYGLKNIPGFQQKTSKKGNLYWDCHSSGMLIPVKDVWGGITGFQVRTNREPKYIWFSYSGQGKASAHVMPGEGVPWIIEGVLKSYVTNYFLNVPCFGIPGTGTWNTIPFEYLRGGQVIVAYDNEDNPHTERSKQQLVAQLRKIGLTPIVAGWNRNLGKGIDDACLAIKNKGITPTPEMFLPGIGGEEVI